MVASVVVATAVPVTAVVATSLTAATAPMGKGCSERGSSGSVNTSYGSCVTISMLAASLDG
jgi:hypothetical protein